MSRRPRGKAPAHLADEINSLRVRAANAQRAGDHHTANRLRTLANKAHRGTPTPTPTPDGGTPQ